MNLFIDKINQLIANTASKYVTTLRHKILFVAVSGLILASIVYTFAALRAERAIMKEEIIKKAEVVGALSSHIGELPLISKNPEHIKKAMSSLMNIPEVSFVVFYNEQAEQLIMEGDITPPSREHPVEEMSIIERPDYFDLCTPVFSAKPGEDIDIFQETDESREEKEHVGWVRIGFTKSIMKEAEKTIIYRGLFIAIVFTLISIIFVFKLFTVATRPLTRLSRAAQSVSKGRYPEIQITSKDEIGTLTTEFNRMSRTIRDREDMLLNRMQLSAFVADIGIALTQSESLQTILQRCADLTNHHFSTALARIWTYDKEKDMLRLNASSGIYTLADSPHNNLPVGKFQAGAVARDLKPVYSNVIDDLNEDDKGWAEQNRIRAFAGYPLIVENRLVGVMEMFSRKPFAEDIFNTLEIVANAIALGIQHKLVEKQIKSSLSEKELLLREIHHRVKNNMQVISSLLNFQTRHIKDPRYVEMFNDSQNRIKSMALIHEKIYRSGSLAHIDFKDYVRSLSSELFRFYGIDESRITLTLDIEGTAFEIDTAIPCGLLINELLTNALKHGFPDNRQGEVKVILRNTDINGNTGYELIVSDNGIGIPEDLDIRNTKSLGMNLIATLAEHQLQGTLSLNRNSRTEFLVRFKKLKYKQRV